MTDPTPKKRRPRPSRLGLTIRRLIRTRVTAGVITVLPILVTIWVIRLIFVWMRDASRWAVLAVLESEWVQKHLWKVEMPEAEVFDVQAFLAAHPGLDWGIAIFSVMLTLFLLYVIGLFAANIFGRRILAWFDQIMDRVPLIKTVYRGLKQILSSFSGDQTQSFRRTALVPFPHEKMRCVAFITNTFKDSVTGEELCSVFIPTTPNPTTGYLQILKRDDITELNWSVEDAIRTIMSGGILKPDFLTIVPNKDLPADLPAGVGPIKLRPPKQPESLPPTDEPPPKRG